MKTTIEVSNRGEGDAIRAALARPEVRAFVLVIGALEALPTDQARARVLRYVEDKLDEESLSARE